MNERTENLHVVLLHGDMLDKQNKLVTTSLTIIDMHDLARSCRTYGARSLFIAHPSPAIRKLGRTIKNHWEEGYGATYNPNRKDAIEQVNIVSNLDEAVQQLDLKYGQLPTLIATSAREGGQRVNFPELRERLQTGQPYLLMLGTGWGMSEALLARADIFLAPVRGGTIYNHLSVRSACAIMLDRLLSPDTGRAGDQSVAITE